MTNQISIIGCGWLGLPLAQHLIAQKYRIKGSTTSVEKLETLRTSGINAYRVELTNNSVLGDINDCLSKSTIGIINVPPGLRNNPQINFINQIEHLIQHIENSSIKKLIFVSSTSVYADDRSMPVITEESATHPETTSGQQLVAIENLLMRNKNFATTIVRFGGLFGKDRHPANYLSGKKGLKNPEAPVNLIHLEDCVGILTAIIETEHWNAVYNAATDPHPTRKTYYTSYCKAAQLPLPEFDLDSVSIGKRIDSRKLAQQLDYKFKVELE